MATALTQRAQSHAPGQRPEAIQWRLVLPMVNEAARVLEEGVTDSTDAIDLATVLGWAFAPFRGGLARFADSVGADQVVVRLNGLAARLGPRFEPAPSCASSPAEPSDAGRVPGIETPEIRAAPRGSRSDGAGDASRP